MTALALVRALHFAGLMVFFGAESLLALLRPESDVVPKLRQALPWLAVMAWVSAALWFFVVIAQITGELTLGPSSFWAVARGTLFGKVFLVRLLLLTCLLVVAFWGSSAKVRIALAGAALAAIALTSHAAASGDPALMSLRAAVDAIHLLTAAFWVGGLVVLLMLAFAYHNTPRLLLCPLIIFSRWAMVAVILLITAGTLNAYFILSGEQGHWSVGYISLLAAKIVLAAIMVALAITNRAHLLPALRQESSEASARDLIVTMSAELALGTVIVVIVAFLGILSPA